MANLAPPDLQFSDIEIIIAVRNLFYCNKNAIFAILRNQALPFLHELGNFCHIYDLFFQISVSHFLQKIQYLFSHFAEIKICGKTACVITCGLSLNMTILTSQIFRKQIRIALSELYQTALWDDS